MYTMLSEKKPMKTAVILMAVLAAAISGFEVQAYAEIREPVVAGRFYPENPLKLSRAIHAYLDDAVTPYEEKPIAILAPHAGYIFSGQICADAFTQAAGHDYDLVVLLGTNHTRAGFKGVSIYPSGGYRTPLGVAQVDETAAKALLEAGEDVTFEKSMHAREHSVEVLVPFVQTLFPNAKIVAAIVGMPDLGLCTRFGKALADVVRGKKALIVASSDLSHYPDYDHAVRVDKKTLEAVTTMDPEAVRRAIRQTMDQDVENLSTCACGEAPILTAMVAAKMLGADCARIVSYGNSGDTSVGKRDRVVGYGAVSFVSSPTCGQRKYASTEPSKIPDIPLNQKQKSMMISFARKTIRQFLVSETIPLPRGFDPVLWRKQGAFVTLKKQDRLRGCIGHMGDDLPLCQVVGTVSLQAAFSDRRFPRVSLDEMAEIEIEISVLTPFQSQNSMENIRVGRDGVLLRKDGRSAVFLPQVATEQGWDRDQMLDRLCQKAGLAEGGWKKDARLYTFQAEVFKETDFQ
jgi:MEMO1 family protein